MSMLIWAILILIGIIVVVVAIAIRYNRDLEDGMNWRLSQALERNFKLHDIIDKKEGEIRQMIKEMCGIEKEARADAVKRSQSGIKGRVSENFAPFLKGFPYKPTDCRFLGDPVDLIVFDGMSDFKSKDDAINVAFVEVKYGKASLSTKQRRIRDAIKNGKVEWVKYQIEGD